MIHSQGSIVVNHPVDEVFAYLTSPEHYRTVGKFPDGGPITGLMEVEVPQHSSQQTKQRLKRTVAVTRYEPDQAIDFRVTSSGWVSSSMSYTYTLEPVKEGARIALDIDLTVQGWMRLFSGLLRLLFKRGVEIELNTLKGKLEARPTEAFISSAEPQSMKQPKEADAIDASIALAKQEPDKAPQRTSSLWALLMRMQPLDLIRLPGMTSRWPQFLAILYILSALALFGWEISTFWESWRTDQWQIFSFAFGSLCLLVMVGAQIGKFTNSGGPLSAAAAQIVRQFVIDGDERVAPAATEQPDTQPTTIVSPFMQGLRLKRPIGPTSRLNLIAILIAFATILTLLLTLNIILNQIFGTLLSDIAGALLALEAVLVALMVWRAKRGLLVQADELGARWSKWRRGHRQEDVLFWSEARAFFTFTIQRKGIKTSPHHIFAIASSTALLAWEEPPGAHTQQQEAHEWFCSLIARQTKLPLRDVSACLEVAQAKSFSALPSKWLTSPLTFIQVPKPRRTRWQLAQAGIIFIPILLCMLSYGISWGLQHYESYHYEQILAHIETQFPLYQDSLVAPDGEWATQPSGNDKSVLVYSKGEYQVHVAPDDYGLIVWPGFTNSNAAVEVTARVLSQDQYQDAGLVLHSKSSKDDYIVFVVDAAGDWHITHDRQGNEDGWLGGYDQSSDIIYHGTGAANRLAVIMQGDQYICYINGHLVGIFHDASAPNGLVGLYVGGAKTIGAFSNFTVYSV